MNACAASWNTSAPPCSAAEPARPTLKLFAHAPRMPTRTEAKGGVRERQQTSRIRDRRQMRYWTGKRGAKFGKEIPKIYPSKADAAAAIKRLAARRWDMNGVSPQPIKCP